MLSPRLHALPHCTAAVCDAHARVQDHTTHYEAVGTLGNLVHSSPEIKRRVLEAGVLQPVINLLQCTCRESLREAALLVGQFAQCESRNAAQRRSSNKEVRAGLAPLSPHPSRTTVHNAVARCRRRTTASRSCSAARCRR